MPMSPIAQPYQGVFPVAPTLFDADDRLDCDGRKRVIDVMIDAGSHGLCLPANVSEPFVLSDDERDKVMVMPPGHGATFRVPEAAIFDVDRTVSNAISSPIAKRLDPVALTWGCCS